MFKFIQNSIKHFLRTDGKVMAPPLSWRTSEIGSKLRYLKNCLMDSIFPNRAGKLFSDIMCSHPDADKVKRACKIFERETGIKMIMTNPEGAVSFNTNANTIIRDLREGRFPKDIKYVVFGHGSGTVLNDTWHVMADPKVKILDFIDTHVPKGEKVLVQCCESTPKELRHLIPKDKPAIGKYATEMYSTYKHPAKIVRSGDKLPSYNRIIGGYGNGIATYYI